MATNITTAAQTLIAERRFNGVICLLAGKKLDV
jgi:hypothetical protein